MRMLREREMYSYEIVKAIPTAKTTAPGEEGRGSECAIVNAADISLRRAVEKGGALK